MRRDGSRAERRAAALTRPRGEGAKRRRLTDALPADCPPISRDGWILTRLPLSALSPTSTAMEYTLLSDSEHMPVSHRLGISRIEEGGGRVYFRLVMEKYTPTCYTEFSLSNEGVFDIVHCYTPPAARGKGVAKELVEASMLFAALQRHKIKCSCSYVSGTFMQRSAEFLASAPMRKVVFLPL